MLDANNDFHVIGRVQDNQEGRPSVDLNDFEGYDLQVFFNAVHTLFIFRYIIQMRLYFSRIWFCTWNSHYMIAKLHI